MSFAAAYLREVAEVAARIDAAAVERMAGLLREIRDRGGRLFLLGVGGSAANASHAVNDFRKLAGIEAYAPTDNVAELTARTNDEGWPSVFEAWLRVSRLRPDDCVLVFSVGGGDEARGVSANLVSALRLAQERGARIAGIVGRLEGYTAQVADACVAVPTTSKERLTPHAEEFQAVIWHLLVSHPLLRQVPGRWEALSGSDTP
jgi:D-sedoheptulose 7-phosphate isomerase